MTTSTTQTKEKINMTTVYATMGTAQRGAKRRGIKHPEYIELHDGRIFVREKGSALHDANQRLKSAIENPVKFVWDLCFKHPNAKRRDIVTRAMEAGVSPNTAKSQYQYWRKASGMVHKHA